MIKICFYSHTIDFAGTWRSHEKIIQNLDKNIFDPYIMFWEKSPHNNRLQVVEKLVGKNRMIPFERSLEKSGSKSGYTPIYTNFKDIAIEEKFDIIHFARSGYYEFPFIARMARLQIETNIFGYKDISVFLDKSISIAKTVFNKRGGADVLIPNPISIPDKIQKDNSIRRQLNIPDDHIVLGRVGRADNFTPIALQAYKLLEKNGIENVHYLIVCACEKTKKFIIDYNLKNIHLFEPTNDDIFLDLFHRNLDIYCHYRSDGEVHSVAITNAMAYGLPVITHYGGYNGQIDTVANRGYVVKNHKQYFDKLSLLIKNKQLRDDLGKIARLHIIENFEEKMIVKKIEQKYKDWMK